MKINIRKIIREEYSKLVNHERDIHPDIKKKYGHKIFGKYMLHSNVSDVTLKNIRKVFDGIVDEDVKKNFMAVIDDIYQDGYDNGQEQPGEY